MDALFPLHHFREGVLHVLIRVFPDVWKNSDDDCKLASIEQLVIVCSHTLTTIILKFITIKSLMCNKHSSGLQLHVHVAESHWPELNNHEKVVRQ